MSNKYYSKQFKYDVVTASKSEKFTLKELTEKYQVPNITLYKWIEKFEKEGINGFETLKSYPKLLKEAAVREYLSGESSQYEIVRKYEITSIGILQWINKYNSHRELKDTSKGRTSSMTKS
ncbi:helix-turn-helix domain-containing protein [Alkalihalobacterium elongatum]|uniref:helix-turn-helix domain-containing protein n=1 Tax=Alkalihalobacterium elongatum TaxID=2675466 RepID=UPI001C1F69EF|nr:helix-turn-helix domain-containing protein [Alkalihalobacterium elongatum]